LQAVVGSVERGDVAIDALAGGLMPAGDLVVVLSAAQVGQREHVNGLPDVVEDDHVIEQPERQVRQPAVVLRRVGKPFDVTDGVVAGVADGAADERRQFRQVNDPHRLHLLAQRLKRVGNLKLFRFPRLFGTRGVTAADLHARAVGFEQ
jgi:hypothetical protein